MSVTDEDFGGDRRNGVRRPPPAAQRGEANWARLNLFSSPLNVALTLGCLIFVVCAVPLLIRFFLFGAVWSVPDRDACVRSAASGACLPFLRAWFYYVIFV